MEKSREDLLKMLLQEEIEAIEFGEIYEHGYVGIIPSSHYDSCEEEFIESVVNKIAEEVSEILKKYTEKNKGRRM